MDYLTEHQIFETREPLPNYSSRAKDINNRIEAARKKPVTLKTIMIVWTLSALLAVAGGAFMAQAQKNWNETRIEHAPT